MTTRDDLEAENAALRERLQEWEESFGNVWSTYQQVWDEHAKWRQRAEAAEDEAEVLRSENLTIGDRLEAQYQERIAQLEAALREIRACASPEHDLCDECCAKVDALLAADTEQDCCCRLHHPNHGRCLQCPQHGMPPDALLAADRETP
jgi:hypothetical protein